MKCILENGIYRIEPETEREADAIDLMIKEYSVRGPVAEGAENISDNVGLTAP